MNSETNKNSVKKYYLVAVENTPPPVDMPEGDWFRYVVSYGDSEINCVRCGTLKEVTSHAEDFVENLNLRTTTGYSGYAARSTKAKKNIK
jgi:hypothetical protein